jgi:hypothetical protein
MDSATKLALVFSTDLVMNFASTLANFSKVRRWAIARPSRRTATFPRFRPI